MLPLLSSAFFLAGSSLLSAVAPAPHHPHDVVSAVAIHPGFPDVPSLLVGVPGTMNLFLRSDNHGYSWAESRSGLRGTQAYDLAFGTLNARANLAFVALGPFGLQSSTDGGRSWSTAVLTRDVRQLAVGRLGVECAVLAAGPGGAWLSLDSGRTFAQLSGPFGSEALQAVAIAADYASDPTVALATGANRLWVSRDGGRAWASGALPARPTAIALTPTFATDATCWVATRGGGVVKSVDGGRTFTAPATPIADLEVNDIAVAPTWPACQHLFAPTKDQGLFRSTDGGASWSLTPLRVDLTPQTDDHFRMVALSPRYPEDPTIACACFEGLNISEDGGATWFESILNPTKIGRRVALSDAFATDGRMFATGYGVGCMESSDFGASWSPRVTEIRTLSTYGMALSPTFSRDGTIALGIDRGVRVSHDAGKSWSTASLPNLTGQLYAVVDDACFSPNYATDGVIYCVSADGLFGSADRGANWVGVRLPMRWPKRVKTSPTFATDHLVFVGGDGLMRSQDAGATFTPCLCPCGDVGTIAFAPDYASTREIFVMSRGDAIYRSADAGTSWTRRNPTFENYAPWTLAVSPALATDGTMFVGTSGGGMFVSTDRGVTFRRLTPLGSGLDAVTCLAISPTFAQDRTLVAGTFEGFWITRDAGATWSPASQMEMYDDRRDPWLRVTPGWLWPWRPGSLAYGVMQTAAADQIATLPFNGNGVDLLGYRLPDGGLLQVAIDGQVAGEIDTYGAVETAGVRLWTATNLADGFHTLTVTTLGRHSDASSGTVVAIDAAIVHSTRGRADLPVFDWTSRRRDREGR
ncbi:MAG: hypothetical protein IPM29_20610 [Planctomycetes bacterium]|nr:hypothetical protein [Planctomycetota bacterium]